MWDGLFMLLSLSLVMAIASFLAGLLPLSFGLSNSHSRVITSIGTGILVGTCLIVIIPEGIETLYNSAAHASAPPGIENPAEQPHEHAAPHAWVGLSLILGFILMYLIDQLPQHATSRLAKHAPMHISLANLSQGPHRVGDQTSIDEDDPLHTSSDSIVNQRSAATTIGLVIHAAADGIALGASSFIEKSSVGFVVFLAIMIHKAPAAFGLTSVLLKQGLTKRLARVHLLVFSLAAPAGAITTWALVNIVAGGQIKGEEGTLFATGLLLLFSGGTFLYVAMHTMQEQGDNGNDTHQNGWTDGHMSHMPGHEQPSIRDTMLVTAGMLLPLVAQVGHAH